MYFLDDRASHPVKRSASKNSFSTSIPLQKNELIIEETSKDLYAYDSQEQGGLLDETNADVNNLNENFVNKNLKFDGLKPFIISKEINLEMLEIEEDIPKVIFDIRSTTWLWIKFANESIDEFVVKENEKVLIEKYPIYVVVGDPENVFLWIKGERYSIEANDPERNIARLTRSQLLQFTN